MRNLLELIWRLRTDVPRLNVTIRTVRGFGIVCLGTVIWNALVVWALPGDTLPLPVRSAEMGYAAGLIGLAGGLALVAAHRLGTDLSSGVWLAKGALWGLLAGLGAILAALWSFSFVGAPVWFGLVARIMMVLVVAQFAVPAWFAMGYLTRLEQVCERNGVMIDEPAENVSSAGTSYREGLFPWGVQATFVGSMALALGGILVIQKSLGMGWGGWMVFPVVAILFVVPLAWNELRSSFQSGREVVASYRVGISLLLFNATAPFCKLLVYRDGLELRVQYNRFFLPYAELSSPLSLEGLLSGTILLKSRLPGVPETIRIHSPKAAAILEMMKTGRVV